MAYDANGHQINSINLLQTIKHWGYVAICSRFLSIIIWSSNNNQVQDVIKFLFTIVNDFEVGAAMVMKNLILDKFSKPLLTNDNVMAFFVTNGYIKYKCSDKIPKFSLV